ncbi:YciI family protein [Gordonia humi]|uniref:YciI family protein n=1 Tax=Gordonia humi TaxID=686429 RepID=UPI00160ABD35
MGTTTSFQAAPAGQARSDVTNSCTSPYLDSCYEQGQLVCSGPQHDRTGGILVVRAPTPEAARAIIDGDPLVIDGWVTYRLTGFAATRAWSSELTEVAPAT